MKSKSSLTLSVVLSLAAAQAGFGADAPKKSTKKPAAEKPAAQAAEPEAKPAVDDIKDPVAVVEGEEIKKADLESALAGMMAQRGGKVADIPAEQRVGAYRMILDDLIIDKLIAKRSAEVKVTDEDVDSTFKRFTASAGSDEEVKKRIEQSGQTIDKVKSTIRTNLRQQRWVEDQIKGKSEVTDADTEDFYKKNPEQFKSPEQVRASHILVSVKADATPDVVTQKEKAAKAIYERVKKGEDFAKLAQELSEDPSAKQNSGDLNFFSKEQMVPEFSTAAFGMKKDDISEPVRSQFGYHVIKVTDRKDAETITLEKAKPQLTAFLQQRKKQEEVEKLVREIRDKAEVKINLPAPAPAAPAAAAPEPAPASPAKP